MKISVNIARILVGLLFIFSGLIKANDPLGLSYKMQEFFDLWGLNRLDKWTLLMSVLMNAFEIIAGFALLLGWRIKLFSWLLLLLIIFFSFLTGYAYLSGKFKSCGCFGDCLPIAPKTSFIKDITLLILIGFLFVKQKWIKPLLPNRPNTATMFVITALCFGIQWYTLSYLPVLDCLPYKKGNNITEKMKSPPGAKPDSFAIRFVYEKGGKKFEFSPSELPDDLNTYQFVSRKDKLIRKGNATPPISGFILSGITDVDSTAIVLSQPYAVLLFCEEFSVPVSKWENKFLPVYIRATSRNIPVYMITTQPSIAAQKISGKIFSKIPIFKCDGTAVRTAARTNPCLYVIKEGTVLGKWSSHRFSEAEKLLNNLPPQKQEPVIVHTDTTTNQ
jgi:uncharacterized membrane protein YphA (DoxX/SURF4 family)